MNQGITKNQVNALYRAMKENRIKMLPETISTFYDLAKETDPQQELVRYQRNRIFFDRFHSAVEAVMNGDATEAQRRIDQIEKEMIELAGKNSPFAKYQESLKKEIANEKQVGDMIFIEGEWLTIQSAEFAAENGIQWNEDENWIYFDSNNDDDAPFIVKK